MPAWRNRAAEASSEVYGDAGSQPRAAREGLQQELGPLLLPSERTGAPASRVFCKSSMKSPLVTLFAMLSSGVCLKVAVRHSLHRTLDAFALAISLAIRH